MARPGHPSPAAEPPLRRCPDRPPAPHSAPDAATQLPSRAAPRVRPALTVGTAASVPSTVRPAVALDVGPVIAPSFTRSPVPPFASPLPHPSPHHLPKTGLPRASIRLVGQTSLKAGNRSQRRLPHPKQLHRNPHACPALAPTGPFPPTSPDKVPPPGHRHAHPTPAPINPDARCPPPPSAPRDTP